MLEKVKPLIFKYYYPLSFLALILLNFGILDNLPFGDDFHFIFSNSEIKNAPNPFLFFNPWSDYFKSWGLSYFFLWFIYKAFGPENIVFYRLINLTLHFICFLLLDKILEKHKINKIIRRLAGFMFLFNPLSVLTTAWIFQFKTLCALIFILSFLYILWFKELNTKNRILLYTTFFCSLLSKITGILLPLYAVFYMVKYKFSLKKSFILCFPLLMLSLFYGLINIKGITHLILELEYIKKDLAEISITKDVKRTEVINVTNKNLEDDQASFNPNIEIFSDIKEGIPKYFGEYSMNKLTQKYIVSLQNLGRLFLYSIGLNDYYPFYENNLDTFRSYLVYVYSFIGLGFLYMLYAKFHHTLLLTIVLFLPISGFFFVPYMKFSYSSDHWFYSSMFGIVLYLAFKVEKIRNMSIIFSICFISYIVTITKYQSFEKVLSLNSSKFDNRIIMEHQSHYYRARGNINSIINDHYKYFKNEQNTNERYASLLLDLARKTNNKQLSETIYPQYAKMTLKKEDLNSLNIFLLKMRPMIPLRTIELTEAMNAYFSSRIDQDLYNRALKHLE